MTEGKEERDEGNVGEEERRKKDKKGGKEERRNARCV